MTYVERQNLAMRVSMRRPTHVAKTFSKNGETPAVMVTYTSCTTTSAAFLRRFGFTPTKEAGISDHVWAIEEIVALL